MPVPQPKEITIRGGCLLLPHRDPDAISIAAILVVILGLEQSADDADDDGPPERWPEPSHHKMVVRDNLARKHQQDSIDHDQEQPEGDQDERDRDQLQQRLDEGIQQTKDEGNHHCPQDTVHLDAQKDPVCNPDSDSCTQ
jgi:hypothetical protein